MRKILAFAASTAISLGAWSVASANGTVKPECAKPVPQRHHHTPHHHVKHHEPACAPCPCLHTGFFGGLKGGYAWAKGQAKHTDNVRVFGTANRVIASQRPQIGADGGLAGVFVGYDFYFPSNWVVGLEGGAAWTNLAGKSTSFVSIPGVNGSWHTRLKTEWSYDVAARIGHRMYSCALWYLKAGAQFTSFKLRLADNLNFSRVREHKFRIGLLGGLGFEIPVNCHLSVGTEYNFTYYQRVSNSYTFRNGDRVKTRIRPYSNAITARLIWKQ